MPYIAKFQLPFTSKSKLKQTYTHLSPGAYTVAAIDMLGRQIENRTIKLITESGSFSLDVSSWKPGAYCIRLYNNKGFVYENQLLISR